MSIKVKFNGHVARNVVEWTDGTNKKVYTTIRVPHDRGELADYFPVCIMGKAVEYAKNLTVNDYVEVEGHLIMTKGKVSEYFDTIRIVVDKIAKCEEASA